MVELEKAELRIQEICEKIRNETLDPAKDEANAIIQQANDEAARIIATAKQQAESIHKTQQKNFNQEKQVFESSLEQACKQTLEQLKLKIEDRFFNPKLADWVQEQLGGAKEHAKLIEVLVQAIQKEGSRSELSVMVPKKFSADQINAELSQEILNSLKQQTVELTDIGGGILVKILDKHMVLDLSSKALEDLVASFIRKDFRKVFFNV